MKKISRANPASEFTHFQQASDLRLRMGLSWLEPTVTRNKLPLLMVLKARNGKTEFPKHPQRGLDSKGANGFLFSWRRVLDTKQKVVEFYFTGAGKIKVVGSLRKITPPTLLPEYGMVSGKRLHLTNLLGNNVLIIRNLFRCCLTLLNGHKSG